jgi:hypothetical protein
MLLTLPSMEPSRVAGAATAIIAIGAQRFGFHAASDPSYIEAPILDVTLCTACGCRAAIAVRSCQAPVCPSRDRKAA